MSQGYEFYHQQFQLFTQRSNQHMSNVSKSSSKKSLVDSHPYPFTRSSSLHKMPLQTTESSNSVKKAESGFWPKRCTKRFDWQSENYARALNHSRTRRLLRADSPLTLSGLIEKTAEDGHGRKPSRSPSQTRLQEDARTARVLAPELFEVDTPRFCPGKKVNIQINRSPQPPRRLKRSVTPSYLTGKDQIFFEDDESVPTQDTFRKEKKSLNASIDKSLEKSPSSKALLSHRHSRDLKSSFSIGYHENQDENLVDDGAENHAKNVNSLLTAKQKDALKPYDLIDFGSDSGSCLHDRTNSHSSPSTTRKNKDRRIFNEKIDFKDSLNTSISSIYKSRSSNDENDPNQLNAKRAALPYKFRDPFKSSLAFLS